VWLDKHRWIMCALCQKEQDIFGHGDGGKARDEIAIDNVL
jgi:ferredoxin